MVILGTDPTKGARGETVATLRTDATFADGQLHSVFLRRDGEDVRLLVDDREAGRGLLRDRSVIGSARAQLFLGGLPAGTKPIPDEFPTPVVPLRGCLSDIYLDFHRVPFLPEAHANTRIGLCSVQPSPPKGSPNPKPTHMSYPPSQSFAASNHQTNHSFALHPPLAIGSMLPFPAEEPLQADAGRPLLHFDAASLPTGSRLLPPFAPFPLALLASLRPFCFSAPPIWS